jgi:cell division protein FtsL
MSGRFNFLITGLLLFSALSLVNAQYQARRLFIELERAQSLARQLDIEWAQLQLDQSTLGKHARIEANARRDLNMVALTSGRTQYLTAAAMLPQTMKAPRLPSPPTPSPQGGEGSEVSRFATSTLSRAAK